MIFAAPWVLAALILLPLLWWLLRATPPAPRAQDFPAIRLLAGLKVKEETPARTPWWLLALRMAAAALVILGLARPVLSGARLAIAASGPALLAIDDGWSSGPDFAARMAAAGAVLDRLERAGRPVRMLTTAPGLDGHAPAIGAVMPAAAARPILDALQPKPWPVDRRAASRQISGHGPVFYLSDGLAGADDDVFAHALSDRGPVTLLRGSLPARLLTADFTPERLVARLRATPSPVARTEFVMAATNDGRVLARTPLLLPAGAAQGEAVLDLPPELRNQLGALHLAASPGAGSVALLDEAARRRPVGLVGGRTGGETPLLGDQYFLDRALGPTTELRHGDIAALLARKLSLLVLTNGALSPDEQRAITSWVEAGGLLIRFASPGLAPTPDADEPAPQDKLLPGRLLPGDRQLGGAMSWSKPAHLAAFPESSPFTGLHIPAEVTVNRQVLADPSAEPAPATWARLEDGTPLVTAARLGAGEVVLFHVTANADWSNLPLSGLFLGMLDRLVRRSAGVAVARDARSLAPALALDGAGELGAPPPAARPIAARDIGRAMPSPAHPPGFYGPERDRHALNLGTANLDLSPMAAIPGASILSLDAAPRERPLGPWLIELATSLLVLDMLLTLWLRGLLEGIRLPRAGRLAGAVVLLSSVLSSHPALAENPALATHLAYVVTGDAQVDATSRAGLAGLSDYVNGLYCRSARRPGGRHPGT